MAALFTASCLIQGRRGDGEGMENPGWKKEKGRGTPNAASELQLDIEISNRGSIKKFGENGERNRL